METGKDEKEENEPIQRMAVGLSINGLRSASFSIADRGRITPAGRT
jgi:hypothetical protein